MQRLGLDYASLKTLNPRLLYRSISTYGQSGPRAAEGGFDLTIQAIGGVMSVTGEADGAPVKCGVPLADFAAGRHWLRSLTRGGNPDGDMAALARSASQPGLKDRIRAFRATG